MELDLECCELCRQGGRVKLETNPRELLIFLANVREQLASRQEIVAKLWRSNLFADTETSINNIVRSACRFMIRVRNLHQPMPLPEQLP
jgi:DNA-binding winged helix-turn-helix (wHTH) protein